MQVLSANSPEQEPEGKPGENVRRAPSRSQRRWHPAGKRNLQRLPAGQQAASLASCGAPSDVNERTAQRGPRAVLGRMEVSGGARGSGGGGGAVRIGTRGEMGS
ncbi:unnamed protein product [Rangifer tarandus platyrhynchus]|uniref:Uncharacterized protein n=2 Tax=Rangifer tarandus platyrhynchus TaxID=3082113 RepID=A0ABN8YG21_RANTA|nr:unnamed protein product [Rangifer tarandus platyrhynchus]CAI9699153.1 unnamed protein product [Rangifer tarandus platyrhynchus]